MAVVSVEERAETRDASTAEDAEDVALMFVKLYECVNSARGKILDSPSYLVVPHGSKRGDRHEETLARQSNSSE